MRSRHSIKQSSTQLALTGWLKKNITAVI